MALEMSALSGFMRLGTQVYPARPNAAQIIERGPHGARLGADPIANRLKNPRGSGFRFWVEQMNIPANESWNPPQRVVGLLGLGASPDVNKLLVCSKGAPPKPDFGPPPPPANGPARSMWKNLHDVAGAACRGRVGSAKEILESAWQQFGPRMNSSWQAKLAPQVQKARGYIKLAAQGAGARLKETESREAGFSSRMKAWNKKYSAAAIAEEKRMNECAKGGKLNYAYCIAMQDPGGAVEAAVTGEGPASWSAPGGFNVSVAERRARGECVGIDPACWGKKAMGSSMFWPVVIGGIVIVGVYAFATGAGSAAARGAMGAATPRRR